jgi:hypothetical protein
VDEASAAAAQDPRTIIVRERLRLLAIGHYVYGGMGLFMLPFFLPFFGMMIFMASIPEEQWNKPSKPAQQVEERGLEATATPSPQPTPHNQAPPKIFFLIFFGIFGAFFLGFVALSALTAYAGRCIQKRRGKTLIYVVAAVNCVFVPYGTLLGVCTLLVLNSPEGRAEFSADSGM